MKPKPDFLAILQTLAKHQVDFIVVGGVGAVLQAPPFPPLILTSSTHGRVIISIACSQPCRRSMRVIAQVGHAKQRPEGHTFPRLAINF